MSSSKSPPAARTEENPKLKLKAKPTSFSTLADESLNCWSDELQGSAIPASRNDPRSFYLNAVYQNTEGGDSHSSSLVPPPVISASPFVPKLMIELLIREKKDSALGVKYAKGDEITEMEGALHTFVTPIIPRCEMVGDYRYHGGHGIVPFGITTDPTSKTKVRLTRSVAMSASIQPDFETSNVMLRASKLNADPIIGHDLLPQWSIPSAADKQDKAKREVYDEQLRQHMIYHLTSSHRLPSRKKVTPSPATKQASIIAFLEAVITSDEDVGDLMIDKFVDTVNNQIVSVELLYNAAVQQVINEFSGLEALFPQGYVYTYDPPSIFAKMIGAKIISRLFLAAVKAVSNHNDLSHLTTFALNDYADANLADLGRHALRAQRGVRCVARTALFAGDGGLYSPSASERGAMLVLHNNSDAFGQNVETEWTSGSLDGAMGANSSAAASLERTRGDLLDFVF